MSASSPPRATAADRRVLLDEVDAAFAHRPYPGDEAIVRRQPGCRGSEAEEAWELFHGKTWRQMIDHGDGDELRGTMAFLSPAGFAYYLPALIHRGVDVDDLDAVDDSLVFRLWSFPEETAAELGPEEKRAVVHLLEYLAEVYDQRNDVRNHARQALDEYWAYFTDRELGLGEDDAEQKG